MCIYIRYIYIYIHSILSDVISVIQYVLDSTYQVVDVESRECSTNQPMGKGHRHESWIEHPIQHANAFEFLCLGADPT